MTNGSHFRASGVIVELHANAQEYASRVNGSIAEANRGVSRHPLSGGALLALTADLFGMHRAVLSLCRDGWAFAAVALLRSMIDMGISAAVITEQESEAEYRGFKYTHFFMKAHLNDAALPTEARARLRAQIQEGIQRLPSAQQQRARDFMFSEALRGYWFSPEYARPLEVTHLRDRFEIGGRHEAEFEALLEHLVSLGPA